MSKIFIIIFICVLTFPGCASLRDIESARNSITELEEIVSERTAANDEFERIIESERARNQEFERVIFGQQSTIDGFVISEENRIAAERKLIDSLSGIFREGSDIIEELIAGYYEIRKFFEPLEIVE